MMKKDTKNLIINTTIALIQETNGDPECITNRDISREAGIAVSQINYHFQTKENLLNQCVQKMVGNMIQGLEGYLTHTTDMTSLEKLETILNMIYTYLYENENLALISILTDHKTPSLHDNTNQTLNVWNPLIEDICSKRNIANPKLIGILLIQSFQGVFLRTNLIKQELEIDLRDSAQRKIFIHKILVYYFGAFEYAQQSEND